MVYDVRTLVRTFCCDFDLIIVFDAEFDYDSLRGLKVRFGARCSDFTLVSCLIDIDKGHYLRLIVPFIDRSHSPDSKTLRIMSIGVVVVEMEVYLDRP